MICQIAFYLGLDFNIDQCNICIIHHQKKLPSIFLNKILGKPSAAHADGVGMLGDWLINVIERLEWSAEQ